MLRFTTFSIKNIMLGRCFFACQRIFPWIHIHEITITNSLWSENFVYPAKFAQNIGHICPCRSAPIRHLMPGDKLEGMKCPLLRGNCRTASELHGPWKLSDVVHFLKYIFYNKFSSKNTFGTFLSWNSNPKNGKITRLCELNWNNQQWTNLHRKI